MNAEKTMARDLTHGNVFKLLISFAAPLMLANLLQLVYSLVDMIVIGQFVGSAGISAVSGGSDILMLFTMFSMGFCNAGQVIISQYVGKNDKNSISKTIGTMFTFFLIFAIVLTVIALSVSKWFINILNIPAEAAPMSYDYVTVCFSGLLFIFGYNLVSAILRGMGDSRRPLVFIAIASVLNLVLDLIFVTKFDMAAKGAALATVIGQGVSFIASLIYLYCKRDAFGFDFKLKSFKIDKEVLKIVLKLGFPMSLQQVAVAVSGLVVSALINSYGLVVSAVAGIGAKLRTVIMLFTSAIGMASSTMVGQNFGAGLHDRVRQVFRTSFTILLILCVFLGVMCMIFPRAVFGIFDTDPEVLALAPKYMIINFFTFLAFALMIPGQSIINGVGHSTLAFFIGIMDGIVTRIGLTLLFGLVLKLGIWGIWTGATAAAYVTAAIACGYYLSGKWKNRKPIVEK